MGYVLIDHYSHMRHLQGVMERSQTALLKVRYYSELMEYARTRTRLTSKILDTEDLFDKDELNQELEIFANRFARTFSDLRELPLNEFENAELERQGGIVQVILPTQRQVVSLSMFGDERDRKEAERLLYEVVFPGQNELIELLQGLVTYHQEGTAKLTSKTDLLLQEDLQRQVILAAIIIPSTLVIAVFVTFRTRLVQRQLEQKQFSLEETIETRTSELRVERDRAEHANLAKSQFLSSMSHELRTPLNAIMGFGQLLEMDTSNPLTKSQKDSVQYILRGGKHLLELINEVLDLAKIESGKLILSVETVDAGAVIKDCFSIVSPLAEKKDITINNDLDGDQAFPFMRADQSRLRQILLNLLSNAIKYNNQGGSVTLRGDYDAAGLYRFSITDTGYGIPEEFHDKVFVPFNRLSAEKTETEGTGIGLSITKQLVELMDGEIGFVSTKGEGSTFWFSLPVATEADIASLIDKRKEISESPSVESFELTNCNILYVEDNPANLELMEMILARAGEINLSSAHTAEIGIEMAKSSHPDLILMDINLPGMDGIQALKHLRNDPEARDIPVIAISANAMPHDINMAMRAGFDEYITKPFDVPAVISTISRELGRKFSMAEAGESDQIGAGREITAESYSPLEQEDVRKIINSAKVLPGQYLSVLENQASAIPDLLIRITEAVEGANAKEAEQAAHTLKTNSGTFGARVLWMQSQDTENLAKEGKFDDIARSLSMMDAELKSVQPTIKKLLDDLKSAT